MCCTRSGRCIRNWRCGILDNYAYYKEVYGGALDEEAFRKLSPACAAVLAVLLCPADPAQFSDEALCAYRDALCRQVDFQAARNTGAPEVSRETLGDYTAVYRDADIRMSGNPVSPDALSILTAAHLICRWI